ncbi:hypothetical protein C8J57DRAFT_1231493 [Mycena rebaudengoi]|nr:hypothetical protein C8J57DRAFT_1231493 [Mycena rebaudengoi]
MHFRTAIILILTCVVMSTSGAHLENRAGCTHTCILDSCCPDDRCVFGAYLVPLSGAGLSAPPACTAGYFAGGGATSDRRQPARYSPFGLDWWPVVFRLVLGLPRARPWDTRVPVIFTWRAPSVWASDAAPPPRYIHPSLPFFYFFFGGEVVSHRACGLAGARHRTIQRAHAAIVVVPTQRSIWARGWMRGAVGWRPRALVHLYQAAFALWCQSRCRLGVGMAAAANLVSRRRGAILAACYFIFFGCGASSVRPHPAGHGVWLHLRRILVVSRYHALSYFEDVSFSCLVGWLLEREGGNLGPVQYTGACSVMRGLQMVG